MKTSLRLGGSDYKTLRIHAKEKIALASNSLLQANGEVDTATSSPSYLAIIFRHFYPKLSASMGVGVELSKDDKLNYSVRGKKSFPLRESHPVRINIKGRYSFDKDMKKSKATGGVELAWEIFNFQEEQDVRVKVGYDLCNQVPYFQLRENNWAFNADTTGKWSIKFDL